MGGGQRVQVEFVSVNPTGPVHIGHGRGAVLGSTLADALEAAGYTVQREYYVNDAGNQMDAFYRSLYVRTAQVIGLDLPMPEDGYMGGYMRELSQEVLRENPDPKALEELVRGAARGGDPRDRLRGRGAKCSTPSETTWPPWASTSTSGSASRASSIRASTTGAMAKLREEGLPWPNGRGPRGWPPRPWAKTRITSWSVAPASPPISPRTSPTTTTSSSSGVSRR